MSSESNVGGDNAHNDGQGSVASSNNAPQDNNTTPNVDNSTNHQSSPWAGRKIRNQFDGTEYIDDDNFQSFSLAQDIVERYPVATTQQSDTMYIQELGVWKPRGEQLIRKNLWHILGNVATRSRVNEVIQAVRHLSRKPRKQLLGLPPHEIIVENKIVDMLAEPGERSRRRTNGLGTFTEIPVRFEEGAFPEHFNDFLFDILPRDDVSVMWELIGYCLFRGYPYQKAFMFIGEGANGKSTLLAALRDFLGKDNIAAAELKELAENRFAKAELDGKLANLAPDISSEALEQTGTFKALTGGDRIKAERKHQDPFHFENHAKLIFSANTVPQADDETYAYKRRWQYFNFPNTFSGDDAVPQQELLESFRQEHAGILNQAIEAFQDLHERGGFEKTSFMREHDDAHEHATNPARQFATERLVEDPDTFVNQKAVKEAFASWCDRNDKTVQGEQLLKRTIRDEYNAETGKNPNDGRYKTWLGIRLKDDGNNGENRQREL
jgi:putative DNA primase/helicase